MLEKRLHTASADQELPGETEKQARSTETEAEAEEGEPKVNKKLEAASSKTKKQEAREARDGRKHVRKSAMQEASKKEEERHILRLGGASFLMFLVRSEATLGMTG